MLGLGAILPGNRTLLLVDLIAIGYIIQPFVAATNGNIFKTVVLSAVWFSIGLYVTTISAPVFTEVYSRFAAEPLEEGSLVTAGMIANKPIAGGILWGSVHRWGWIAAAVLFVVWIPLYLLWRKNKVKVQNFMEEQAELDVAAEAE
jgi:PTS system galactitol-specific IIC component